MSDLIQSGVEWLHARRTDHMSQAVTYQRGAQSASVSATRGSSPYEEIDADGIVHRHQTRDYIVRTADMLFTGVPIKPQDGDKIVDGTQTYTVCSLSGDPPWRYTDAHRAGMRIHTKLTAET